MRCKYCEYITYDYSENCELCGIFGYGDEEITINSKGDEGCKYTEMQLAALAYSQEGDIQYRWKIKINIF